MIPQGEARTARGLDRTRAHAEGQFVPDPMLAEHRGRQEGRRGQRRPICQNVVRWLLLYGRAVTRHALPFSVWHLYPRIGPALKRIERLSSLIGTLALEAARRYGRVTEDCYFHILILDSLILSRFRDRQALGPIADFPFGARVHELVRQQRGNEVGIIRLLRLHPLIFQRRDRFLGSAARLLSLRR